MSKDSNLEYRKIPSLYFLYEVNSNGTVIRNVKSKRHLKIFIKSHNSKTEYACTQINIKHHIRKVFIHRVVAECWLGKRPEGMMVDHIDRNSLNNDYRNLRYVTRSEQMINRNYDAFIDICLKNLSSKNKGIVNPVKLTRDKDVYEFETARKASKFLSKYYVDKTEKCFNDKFHHRRKHIFDFDVEYLGMQRLDTAAPRSKEQSTLSDLTTDYNNFNKGKIAEVEHRVKHTAYTTSEELIE